MTEDKDVDLNEIITNININQVLMSILKTIDKVTVPTQTFIDCLETHNQLVIDYDDEGPSFIFSLENKKEHEHDGIFHTHD